MTDLRFRPVTEDDLVYFRRLSTDAEFLGLDWHGFRSPAPYERRFADDGFLGGDESWLVVERDSTAVALVNWGKGKPAGLEIGILVFPEWRRQGIGWRAQAMLCDYLFAYQPVQRIYAGTHPENVAEQKALEKAGFHFEGALRAVDFRAGRWHDCLIYSRLRTDPAPVTD